MNTQRPPGFYWVKAKSGGRWEPAELIGRKWYVIAVMRSLTEADFGTIGQRINPPLNGGPE